MERIERRTTWSWPRRRIGGAASMAAGVALTLGACESREETRPEVLPEVEDVAEAPAQYVGETVTLVGEVDTVFGERSFELEGDDLIFDEEILVLTRSPVRMAGETLSDDDEVVVTGTVQIMQAPGLEEDLGWDIDLDTETRWRGQPVLVADSISMVEEYARWSSRDEQEGTLVGLVTVYTVPDPQALIGQQIAFDSVPVTSVTGNLAWIGYGHRYQVPLAAEGDTQMPELQPGDLVDVRGTLKAMPQAREAMQQWKVDRVMSTQLAQEPLYIAATEIKEVEAPATSATRTEPITYAVFAKNPARYLGQTVAGEARVARVISDRAFYLETEQGADASPVLAIVREDVPQKEMIDINAGQKLRFSGQVMAPGNMNEVAGTLEQDAKQAIEKAPAFLAMHWRDVEILGGPEMSAAQPRDR